MNGTRRVTSTVCLALLLAGVPPGAAQSGSSDLGGRLAREVVLGTDETFEASVLTALPVPQRERIERYLERRDQFRSRLSSQDGPPALAERRAVERALVSLIEREGIEEVASDVASSLAVTAASARSLDGTLAELESAERYLRANADTPAAPFLYAYVASRCRLAIELSAERAEKERLARKYRTMMDRLRNAPDPVFSLVARDLDALPSMAAGGEHPREYLPPG